MSTNSNTETRGLVPSLTHHAGAWVTALDVNSDGLIAAGTINGTIELLDCQTATAVGEWKLVGDVTAVAAAPHGRFIACTADDRTYLIEAEDREPRPVGEGGVYAVALQDGGLVLGSRNGRLSRISADGGVVWAKDVDTVWRLDCGPSWIACASSEGSIEVVGIDDGSQIWKRNLGYPVYGVVGNEEWLYAGTAEGRIVRFDWHGNEIESRSVDAVRFLKRDGTGILAGTAGGRLQRWSNLLECQWSLQTASWVKDAISTSHEYFVGSADHGLYKLDSNGKPVAKFEAGYSILCLGMWRKHVVAGSADEHVYAFPITDDTDYGA